MGTPLLSMRVMNELEDRAERERNLALGDICDAIRYSKMELTSMDDNAFELANHLHRILADDEDDKLGRLRDIHDEYVMRLATWILDDNGFYSNQLKRKLGAVMSEQKQMHPLRFWITAISTDGLIAILLYQWHFNGVEQAGNVAIFWLWVAASLNFIVGIGGDRTLFEKNPRPAGFGPYHFVTEFLFISAMVWVGCTWLAVFYTVSSLMKEGALEREPKRKAEGKQ